MEKSVWKALYTIPLRSWFPVKRKNKQTKNDQSCTKNHVSSSISVSHLIMENFSVAVEVLQTHSFGEAASTPSHKP